MITDKQGQEWLLQKLYDDGWKYYVKNVGSTAFVTTKRPVMNDGILDINSGGHVMAWEYGATSWSVDDVDNEVYRWEYAKLAEV